jgi:hypothetical protein
MAIFISAHAKPLDFSGFFLDKKYLEFYLIRVGINAGGVDLLWKMTSAVVRLRKIIVTIAWNLLT